MYGTCFLLNPHCTIEIRNSGQSPLSLWFFLTFSMHMNQSHPPALLEAGEFTVPHFEVLVRELQEIAQHQYTADTLQQMAAHHSFQKLMGSLLQHLGPHQKTEKFPAGCAGNHCFAEGKITSKTYPLRSLPGKLKISNRRFTHWFKLLTGTNVSGYMTALRINHAKELLLGGGRLQEIANTVGYRDEYYFNRRFRQTVGISPRSIHSQSSQEAGEHLRNELSRPFACAWYSPHCCRQQPDEQPASARAKLRYSQGQQHPDAA
ncbi:helix-turn-helix transcriptional regulator [Paenibacillus rhizoplanae]